MLTVDDLTKVMGEHSSQPYGNQWMKKKMMERFKEDLVVHERYGRKDVVLLQENTHDLFSELRLVLY